tara:strand:+ start:1135 stop:1323 length:189 start_codon:yes stop_codon:yes gene_type:complete
MFIWRLIFVSSKNSVRDLKADALRYDWSPQLLLSTTDPSPFVRFRELESTIANILSGYNFDL